MQHGWEIKTPGTIPVLPQHSFPAPPMYLSMESLRDAWEILTRRTGAMCTRPIPVTFLLEAGASLSTENRQPGWETLFPAVEPSQRGPVMCL